jgi:hypothetical protein
LSLDWQDLRAAVDGGADVAVLKGLDAIAVGDRLHLAYFVDIPTGYNDVDPHGKFRFVGGVEPRMKRRNDPRRRVIPSYVASVAP